MAIVGPRVIKERSVTITATAQTLQDMGFTAPEVAAADGMKITVEAAIRYTYGSVVPTAAIGHYVTLQVEKPINATNIKNMKFIRVGGSDVTGFVTLTKL